MKKKQKKQHRKKKTSSINYCRDIPAEKNPLEESIHFWILIWLYSQLLHFSLCLIITVHHESQHWIIRNVKLSFTWQIKNDVILYSMLIINFMLYAFMQLACIRIIIIVFMLNWMFITNWNTGMLRYLSPSKR